MNKKLWKASKIVFNIIVVLTVFINLASYICGAMEETITEYVFGGYKKITEYSENSIVYPSDYESVSEVKAAALNVANAAESEGAVLLKNNDALPLKEGDVVNLYSVSSVEPLYAGAGGAIINSIGNNDKITFPMALEAAGLDYNKDLYNWYESNLDTYGRKNARGNGTTATIDEAPWSVLPTAKSQNANAGIFLLSRVGTEGKDLESSYLKLDSNEISVLKGMKEEKAKGNLNKIIVLLNSANPINLDFVDNVNYGIDAVLWIGLPGTSGLYGVCDILTGLVTPSGRLPDTWYIDNTYNPALANYGNFNHGPTYVVYQEGVYLGYRYTETRYEDKVLGTPKTGDFDYSAIVKYPFGYGTSYTTFEWSNYKKAGYDKEADEYTFTVDVKNTGTIAGKEVVQLYLQQPYTEYDKINHIEKPSVELVGFAKTKKLQPNESETLTIKVSGRSLASYDAYGAKTYYLDAGDYCFAIGNGAHDALNNVLALKGKKVADGMTEEGNAKLVVKENISAASATAYAKKVVKGNEVEITNLFDFADPNRLDDGVNTVNYFSRNDWTGTLPNTASDGKFSSSMHAVIKNSAKISEQRTTDQGKAILKKDENGNDKVYPIDTIKDDGREYPKYNQKNNVKWQEMRQNPETGELIAYDDPKWELLLDQLSWEQTCEIISSGFRKTPTSSINAENGFQYPGTYDPNGPNGVYAGSYGNSQGTNGFANVEKDPDKGESTVCYPCLSIIAATFNTDLAEEVGKSYGEEALWAGVSGIYAFTVNLHRYATHGRMCESYSEDPVLTGIICGYQSLGCQKKGLYVYTKHFVLNEQETNRISHESWINEQTMRQIYLKAFEVSIGISDGRCVMTSFARVGGVWAGHDYNLTMTWLRGECGLSGFAVTDSYMSSYMSIKAGVLCGQDLPDGNAKVSDFDYAKTGASAVAWAMRESAHRIMYTAVHSNRVNGLAVDANVSVTVLTPTWVKVKNGVTIAANVLGGLVAALFVASVALVIVNKKKAA